MDREYDAEAVRKAVRYGLTNTIVSDIFVNNILNIVLC
jgi:hypothetical protein